MAAPTFDAPGDAHHRRLPPSARMFLLVLGRWGGGISLFAGVVLRDLFPFIGVICGGF
ncbi:hypothetical protein [Azospirillum sp. B4]|uniref:hypothetical protein n=1 Tax=Azospirillum sp. B4 TaxID=95605 RepID=UPI00034990A0|nr:hypothetical protein [Azospirillum sp. B4]